MKVYDDEKIEYDSVVNLQETIMREWEKIEISEIRKIIEDLFTKKLEAVIENDGDYTE